jgi:anti-sigma factor RsiW
MQCAESLRVQAYFDAAVDAVSAIEIERHIDACEECRALLRDLEGTRAALRSDLTHLRASPALRRRISHALDQESAGHAPQRTTWARATGSTRSFWWGALGGIGASVGAAAVAFVVMAPVFTNPLVGELVGAHLRSLMPTHLFDVASTDRHTVKPWFAGHADVSPVVADFADQGYRLVGGRADYLDQQRSAVTVYQHGAHIINVFSWATQNYFLPNRTTRSGYHLIFWREGDLEYCAVSDTGWDELQGLARLLRDLGERDRRE